MPGDVSSHRPRLLLDEPLRPHASGRAPATLQLLCGCLVESFGHKHASGFRCENNKYIYIYTLYYIRTIQYYTAFVYSIFVFTSGRLQLWQVVEDVCLVVAPQNGDWYTCCSHQNPGQQLHYSLHAWNIYLHTYGLHTIASPRLSLFSESLLSQVFPSTPEAQGANGIVPKIRIRKAQRREGAASGQIQHLTRSITMGK